MDYIKHIENGAKQALIEYLRGDHDEMRDAVIMNVPDFVEPEFIAWYLDDGLYAQICDDVNALYEGRGSERFSIATDLHEMAYCIAFVLVFREVKILLGRLAAEHENANF